MPAMNSSETSSTGQLLDASKIAGYCCDAGRTVTVQVVAQTGSTNTDLLSALHELNGPVLLVAESQTAGRGRAGRSWLSANGDSLTFSVAWPFAQDQNGLTGLLGLPLAVGVAVAETLLALEVPVQLKWPNDILKAGQKLAGVLVETAVQGERNWAVIGIGLNLRVPDQLEAQIGHGVADATWLAQMDRNQLLAQLLDRVAQAMQRFAIDGLTSFVERWNALHAHAGKPVNLIDQGRLVQQGTALGINQQGCLLLRDEQGGVVPVMAGDVSLRAS
jgi:BirA family biotin operon repressor/biotin-[acetyl-CoA-carboxylase] ligase